LVVFPAPSAILQNVLTTSLSLSIIAQLAPLVANFSIGALAPLALRIPLLARIASLSSLKGAYPLQTTPGISEFLSNSEMFSYKERVMIKTFYLKFVSAKEIRERIKDLGVITYSCFIDVDERLNALTVNTPHEGILKQIEDFIAAVDKEAPPGS